MNETNTQGDMINNAPENVQEQPKPEEKHATAGKPKRKRRRFGVPITLTAVLVILALLAGLVVGFAYATKRSKAKIDELKEKNEQLALELENASGEEVDIFTESLTPAEQEALDQLSGEAMQSEGNELASALNSDVFGESDAAQTTENVVVAEYNGGTVMSDEARAAYAERVAERALGGFDEAANGADLLDRVLTELVREGVLKRQAENLGVAELTDADNAEIDARAKSYAEQNDGMTYEAARELIEEDYRQEKLRNEVVKDVTVTDEEVRARYDELLAAQRTEFTESADAYEYARMNGGIVTYDLPGYRRIEMITYELDDAAAVQTINSLTEQIAALDPEKDADEIAKLNEELDICYTPAEARAKALMEKLDAGEDFEEIASEHTDDAVVTTAYISESSPMWSQEVRTAAASLEKTGDYTGPVRTGSGVCVMRYAGDVSEGDVAYEDVKDDIRAQLLAEAQDAAYEAQVSAWMTQAAPKYYPERIQ